MYRSAFQKGFLTVLYAGGANPLKIWDRCVMNGHVKRITDEDVRTLVLEMCGTNVATCYIYTPIDPKDTLGIKLPFLVMIIKNLKKYFSFEIMILDDRRMRRRFRVSNYQSTTKVRPFGTTMPIGLNPGWNQIQFNLADFTKRAYGSTYMETLRIQIHANCRIRRIYFCDRLYNEDELPQEYKLFYPVCEEKAKKAKKKSDDEKKEAEVPPPSEAGDEAEAQIVAAEEEEYGGEGYEEGVSMEVELSEEPGIIPTTKGPSAVEMTSEDEGEEGGLEVEGEFGAEHEMMGKAKSEEAEEHTEEETEGADKFPAETTEAPDETEEAAEDAEEEEEEATGKQPSDEQLGE